MFSAGYMELAHTNPNQHITAFLSNQLPGVGGNPGEQYPSAVSHNILIGGNTATQHETAINPRLQNPIANSHLSFLTDYQSVQENDYSQSGNRNTRLTLDNFLSATNKETHQKIPEEKEAGETLQTADERKSSSDQSTSDDSESESSEVGHKFPISPEFHQVNKNQSRDNTEIKKSATKKRKRVYSEDKETIVKHGSLINEEDIKQEINDPEYYMDLNAIKTESEDYSFTEDVKSEIPKKAKRKRNTRTKKENESSPKKAKPKTVKPTKSNTKPNTVKPNTVKPVKPNTCTGCGKSYKNAEILEDHQWNTCPANEYKCVPCKMAFATQERLDEHEETEGHLQLLESGLYDPHSGLYDPHSGLYDPHSPFSA